MDEREVERWIGEVVDAIEPSLLAQARMCHRLSLTVQPPEVVAGVIAETVLERLRAVADVRGPAEPLP